MACFIEVGFDDFVVGVAIDVFLGFGSVSEHGFDSGMLILIGTIIDDHIDFAQGLVHLGSPVEGYVFARVCVYVDDYVC